MRGTQNSLNATFKTGDRDAICDAIFAVIHGTGNVSAFALKAGVDRTMLYRAFKRNLRFDIILRVMRAADLKLVVVDHPGLRSKPSLTSEHLNGAFGTDEIMQIVKSFDVALRAQQENVALAPLYRIRLPHVPRLDAVLSFLKALGLRLAVIEIGHG
jgi:DNA-binding phage protein